MAWAPDYVDEGALADFVRTESDNPYVGTYGTAAARAVDDTCNRQFGQLDEAATFTYDSSAAAQLPNGRWLIQIDDVQDLTGVTISLDGITLTEGVDGYEWWERNAVAKGKPYTAITLASRPAGELAVLAKFGWSAVPAPVPAAVWLQVNRWHVRRESPYGTAGSPGEGSEVRLSARLDPDARAILAGGQLIRARMPQ